MRAISRSSKYVSFFLILFVSIIASSMQYWKVTEYFDWVLYDIQMPLWQKEAPNDIAIIEIDEKSIAQLGRWPWSRQVHAQILDQLSLIKTGPIVFNVLFPEPSLDNNGEYSNSDIRLAQSINHNKKVILPLIGVLSDQNQVQELLPIPSFFQATQSIGHADLLLDSDGLLRRVFLYSGLNQARWPSLALAAYRANGFDNKIDSKKIDNNKNLYNNWIRDYSLLLPLVASPRNFNRYSYSDVFSGKIDPKQFENKVVFIGATAKGIATAYPTVLSKQHFLTGVEIQAYVYDALHHNNFIRELDSNLLLLITFVLTFLSLSLLALADWSKNQLYLIILIIALLVLSKSLVIWAQICLPLVSVILACVLYSIAISVLYSRNLHNMAELDNLTHLYNRYSFDYDLQLLWKNALDQTKSSQPKVISLLVLNFECVNNGQCQQELEQQLIAIANELQYQAKKRDHKTYRINNNELACLIVDNSNDSAQQFAQDIQTTLNANEVSSLVSISIAMASQTPNNQQGKRQLLQHANQALFQIKKQAKQQANKQNKPSVNNMTITHLKKDKDY